jgi:hypothetical protein
MVMAEVEELDAAGGGDDKQGRSTIEFPYMNLGEAISVAQGIRDTTGSGACQHDQLAAAITMSPKSSGYRMRLSGARMFGLIETAAGGVKLTELGHAIVDSVRARDAKAKAFLNVPLFRKIYENNRGKQLPPPAALEREMEGLGVIGTATERARQVFQRSAETAGYFEMDRTRLIMPAGTGASEVPPATEQAAPEETKSKRGGGDGFGDHDPLIIGMFRKLPAPEAVWDEGERLKWLQTVSNIFDLVYKGDCAGFHITPARADRSPRPHN